MAIDFNTAPYYDDFDKEGNFYRILFKPGRAVQARELTQLQTSLQNQIETMGRNIYKDGSIIMGGRSSLNTGSFIKVQETTDIAAFEGQTVIGATSGAKAIVRKTTPIQTIGATSYNAALHVVYIYGSFVQNETITIDGTTISVTSIDDGAEYAGQSLMYSVEDSVFFTKGHFVFCPSQTVVVSPTFTFRPSARIGLRIEEGIITSEDDASLLDPAIGASNYFAPGADRYYIDLVLSTIEYDYSVEDSDTSVIDEFIEICNVRRGEIVSINSVTQFNEIENALARRTYDESGDYTVRPFITKVKDHLFGNVAQLSVEVSPGKAYVRGYEFETVAPSYITMERARDVEIENGYSLALDYSRFIPVANLTGFFNFTDAQQVAIHRVPTASVNATNATTYAATTIGTARARYLEYDTGGIYNFYLFDINLNSGNAFSEANSFVIANVTTSTVIAKCDVTSFGNAAFTYGVDDSFLFKIPQENIKTYANVGGVGSGITDTTYQAARNFSSVNFVPGTGPYSGSSVATLTVTGNDDFIGSGVLSDTAIRERFYAVVTSTTASYPSVGQVINFTGASGEVEISGQNAFLRMASGNTFSANVVAVVASSQATSKVKTLTSANVVWPAANGNAYINLTTSDVYDIISIADAQGNNYLSAYVLDNGQRDDLYDHGNLILSPGSLGPVLGGGNPNVVVQFRYFTHSGAGFFNADSYINGGLDWGSIPNYTNSKGESVRLSDVIDFRPVRQNNSAAFITGRSPQPGSSFVTDFEYYLPRKDKLVLTKERKLTVVKGVPSTSPTQPSDLQDSMTLYSIDVPPYTASPSDVKFTYVDNKRYTMRDIGKIEKRVGRLEYYSALSLLEKAAADERIPGAIPGIDRFKNGILVDSFAGHSVSDVNNGDLRCSIDFENRTLRPRFTAASFFYSVNPGESSGYIVNPNGVVTLAFNQETFISQTKATGTVNLTPFEVFSWKGTMTLTPSTDIWADTVTNPAVTVNLNGENDAFTQITQDRTGLSPWGTRWNDWQSVFRGITDVNVDTASSTSVNNKVSIDNAGKISVTPTATTTTTTSVTKTTQESLAATGLQFSAAAKTIESKLGEKVIDSSIIPYIRSRNVVFAAKSLKPNTNLFATFDGQDVTRYCVPGIKVKLAGNIANNISELRVVTGSGTRAQGDVIAQRANVLYLSANVSLLLPEVGNTATLISSTTTTSASVVSIDVSTTLTTNEFGDIAGIFKIPSDDNLKFNMGERAFKLADSLDTRFISTVAETKYLAYGLSQTKQDTILATRMNLVSIDPLLAVKSGDSRTSIESNINQGIATVGTTNAVQLPPPQEVNIQTTFCGEAVKSTGQNGTHYFIINLGPEIGPANVICYTSVVPNNFTLSYGGQDLKTGMMTSTTDAATIADYNSRLKEINYPEITRTGATSGVKLSIIKQRAGENFATLKIDAPIKGTGWRFDTDCVSGTSNPSPGTLSVAISDTALSMTTINVGRDGWADSPVSQTGVTDLGIRCTVTNTASNPRWTKDGIDKSVNITNIAFNAPGGGTYTVITTGTGQGTYSGTLYPNKTSATYQNTLGALPVLLQPGESRTFTIRVQKGEWGRINGTGTVVVTGRGPGTSGTQNASTNQPTVAMSTWEPQFRPPPQGDDPVSQTFFVNKKSFPNGLFVSSIDLWFYDKDPIIPVSVEIRPVVNGYPSSLEIIPFAYKVLDSDQITASTTFNKANFTRFNFGSPVYLPPDQYALVVRGNSKRYVIYTAKLGEFMLDAPEQRVTEQPYVGSMFKSQNSSTWTPEQMEDITFRINKCVFDTTTPAVITMDTVAPSNNVEYDVFFTTGETIDFADTDISYTFKTTSESTGISDASFRRYLLGSNVPLEERKVVRTNAGTTLKFGTTLTTNDSAISPVFDLERVGSVLVRNIINNDATGEDGYSGGNALARYITRRVTLAPGFEAQDLKVYLNAYCPGPSTIRAYYKVNAPGTTQFDTQNRYIEMATSSVSGDTKSGFAEYLFENATNTCLPDGARFNTFVIKIVMLSSDPTQVPIIRDLRALALDD